MEKLREAFKKRGLDFDETKYESCLKAYEGLEEYQKELVCFQIRNGGSFAEALEYWLGKFKEPIEMLEKALDDANIDKKLSQEEIKKFENLDEEEQEEVCVLVAEFDKTLKEAFEEVEKYGAEHRRGRYKEPSDLAYELVHEGGFSEVSSDDPILRYVDWEKLGDDLMEDYSTWNPDDGGDEIYYWRY